MDNEQNARLSDDLIHGIEAISEEIGVNKRRGQYLAETGRLPIAKLGNRWIASRSRLREYFENLTASNR